MKSKSIGNLLNLEETENAIKRKTARKRGQSSPSNHSNSDKKSGSLRNLKLNRNNKKKIDRGLIHGMFSHVQDVTFNGKIVIGNRYLLKDGML